MIRTRTLALCTFLGACGSVEKGSYKPTIGTLDGQISLDSSAVTVPDAPIRVALLWAAAKKSAGVYTPAILAQEVGVSAELPSQFVLDLTDPPPAGAVQTASAWWGGDAAAQQVGFDLSTSWAQATLVVYADNDKNGKLDMVDSDTASSPDTVLGASTDYSIFYLASGPPGPSMVDGNTQIGEWPTVTGLSVVHTGGYQDPTPGLCETITATGPDAGVYSETCGDYFAPSQAQVLAAGAPISIVLKNDPVLQHFACTTYPDVLELPDDAVDPSLDCTPSTYVAGCDCEGFDCPLDLPPTGVPVTCSADKSAYVYKTCNADDALCGVSVCHFGQGAIVPGSTPPANWPCN